MLNMLLIMGDTQMQMLSDQPIISPVTGRPLSDYKNLTQNMHIIESQIFTHRRHIDAAMNAIKPGICSIFCQKFTKEMIYEYLQQIKYRDIRQ